MARAEKGFQPLLADEVDISKLRLPVMGSPKLDGIRCIIRDGVAVSRKLKPLPNDFIQDCLRGLPDELDGEIIVGDPTANNVWNVSQSGCMRKAGESDFRYYVFDYHSGGPFVDRYSRAAAIVEEYKPAYPWLELVPHTVLSTMEELEAFEQKYVELKYEGVMLRSLDGLYKYGRSTVKEGYLLKWKRFIDHEAECIGYVERMQNTNTQETDERGYAKRSKAKAGMVGCDTLGTLQLRIGVRADGTLVPPGELILPEEIVDFEVGTGFTDEDRAALWARRDTDLKGSWHKLKFQGLSPEDKKPRISSWQGERDARDMS